MRGSGVVSFRHLALQLLSSDLSNLGKPVRKGSARRNLMQDDFKTKVGIGLMGKREDPRYLYHVSHPNRIIQFLNRLVHSFVLDILAEPRAGAPKTELRPYGIVLFYLVKFLTIGADKHEAGAIKATEPIPPSPSFRPTITIHEIEVDPLNRRALGKPVDFDVAPNNPLRFLYDVRRRLKDF
ncbi:MAG: hypothetical protein A3J67_02260 [Parcubacteria group bacterium RIFCSPHIGHO2_02_FULL_48_10b]|nr:MAG: hypothetical protein A3J67_02260 [Parcubacteria group bacterium RIFCSPHIGHO2_02_FULL_48_10b]